MFSRSISLLLSLALLSPVFAVAGTVETNVRICGNTEPYQRYGESAAGLFGSSSTGLQDQLFRFKGFLGVEGNADAPELSKNDSIADFISATELPAVKMCVRGNLETVERAGAVSYYMSPKSYQILEKSEEYLGPSQISGNYAQRLPSAPTLALQAIDDAEFGRRFMFAELPAILRSLLGAPCSIIDKAIAEPANFSLIFHHKQATVLFADALQECGPNDPLKLHVELRKSSDVNMVGIVTVERPANSTMISLEIHR
ncbi:MAG: hypothetical protein HY074_16755 [Deltaproteobacteria bacterium]|nr:hypothetical protein [Deltaproteobacteria bacterium]